MRCVRGWLGAVIVATFCAAIGVAPGEAIAHPKVAWAKVGAPEGRDAARMSRMFRQLLERATHKADFGKRGPVSLSARILKFSAQQTGDVLHVTCAAVGRVEHGPTVRSQISFGGSPRNRSDLEKQVLTMVANGLVARLSQIVRTQKPPTSPSTGTEGAESPSGGSGQMRLSAHFPPKPQAAMYAAPPE